MTMPRAVKLLPVLILVLLMIAACGGTAVPAPTAAAPTAAAESTATEEVVAEEATAIQEPAAEAVVEPTPVETAMPEVGQPAAITADQLRNATYSGIYDEPVTLTEGLYEGEPFAEGDPARPTVEYVEGAELYGDLDGDGVEDAVVFLREWSGGTGHFTYVAAQLNQDGQPVDAGTVWMDEISVRSAAIEDGQVWVEIVTMGPGDADCCQTHKASRTYALEGGQLAEMAAEEEDLEQISAVDLNGTSWTLVELGEGQPALDDVEVTISFQDGQISGSGGCNNYNSSFSLGEDNPFVMTISPVASTKMACPEPILEQETSYFAALENVSQWGYEFGRLALPYYVEGQAGLSRLLFAPQAGAASAQADRLAGQTWQWVSFTDPLQAYEVESPESYTLAFNEDGTVNIVADCNNASGSYTDEDGALSIEIGPMTMAACPPDSRSDEFVKLLGGAARYFFEEGFLYIDLLADGGTMAFTPQTEPGSAGDITSYPWLWTSFTNPIEQVDVDAPENYVATFNDDGTVSIKADCNNASGSYTVDGSSLTIEVGPMTKAACPPDSRSDQFVELLGYAAIYFFEDAQLHIDLFADGGTMVFAPEGEAELAAAADAAQSVAGSGLPAAEIANDEGGPEVITGEWNYTSSLVATHFEEPVVALVNVSPYVQGNWTDWVPQDQQILGRLTSPMSPAPAAYRLYAPMRAEGASADLDNDGEEDAGVQVYALWVASNINGDSYLHQLDQTAYHSYLLDPNTGTFRQGTFLVYAPDDAQGFPSSAGEDGVFFTADDPAVALPAGYTLVTLGSDGEVNLDRSSEVRMDTLEEASVASPDFSDQGILASYNSLIDLLKVRYSYTELRDLDWEAIRQAYLPQVQAADEAGDMVAYYLALNDMAISIRDAHVYVVASDAALKIAPAEKIQAEFGASLGAGGVELSDGRYIINFVDPEGPAAEAGWQFGTEIVTVDGVPMSERIDSLPLQASTGNPEVVRLTQATLALGFPDGAETTIEYRQPGESELRSATLTAAEGLQTSSVIDGGSALIDYKQLDDGYGYVRWSMFREPLYTLAIWEEFLGEFHAAPGIVIDLRGNVGGNAELMHTMASYFFSEEDPASYHWLDYYTYDEKANDLVKGFAEDFPLYSPKPDLAYTGAVAVLVDQGTASAGEYFPQFLQYHDRALVVGEHGTEGAGGSVEQAALPGGITFHFTKGRSYFAGTDELNLEAKGVTLDVRVPVNGENEQAKSEGQDPVLEAAVEALGEEAVRFARENVVGKTWQLLQVVAAPGGPPAPAVPENYTITFGDDGAISIQTDCNQAGAEYTFGGGGAITVTTTTTTLAACPEGSLAEEFIQWLGSATSFQTDGEGLVVLTDPASGLTGMLFIPVQ